LGDRAETGGMYSRLSRKIGRVIYSQTYAIGGGYSHPAWVMLDGYFNKVAVNSGDYE